MLWPYSCVGKCGRHYSQNFVDKSWVINTWCHAISGRLNGQCIRVFISIWVLGVKQSLIPYMWQVVPANILVKGWIVDLYTYWFFYCPSEVLLLYHQPQRHTICHNYPHNCGHSICNIWHNICQHKPVPITSVTAYVAYHLGPKHM